jgi:nitroimidazol reductase NimA-like FMN-containing flavoprotein (pyridoxamine 5'-phosphate oxidase superfamily)
MIIPVVYGMRRLCHELHLEKRQNKEELEKGGEKICVNQETESSRNKPP